MQQLWTPFQARLKLLLLHHKIQLNFGASLKRNVIDTRAFVHVKTFAFIINFNQLENRKKPQGSSLALSVLHYVGLNMSWRWCFVSDDIACSPLRNHNRALFARLVYHMQLIMANYSLCLQSSAACRFWYRESIIKIDWLWLPFDVHF